MNSQSWIYLDDRGGKHPVAMFHRPRDGKLLVMVDGKVAVASNDAKQGGRWTFLIEEELCDIAISRRGLEFFYAFEVNRRADTPRNRAIRVKDRRDFWLPMSIFLGAMAIGALLVFGRGYFFKKKERPAGEVVAVGSEAQLSRLSFSGKRTVAVLSAGARAGYSFKNELGRAFGGSFLLAKNWAGQPVMPNGLPLADGDEFEVAYLPEDPAVHRLFLGQPTENQLVSYEQRAAEVHRILHPGEPEGRAACLARTARRATGLRGLNDLFYQNLAPAQNPRHNRESFQRLVRDEAFKKLLLENCLE